MLTYLGDFKYGSTVTIIFGTYSSVTGASITLTGLAVTDIEIYKNGSTTQRASDAGYTLLDTDGIDFDATTGVHGFSVDTSNNTTAGFFGPGNDYTILVNAVTIDAVTVVLVFKFSIENRYSAGLLLRTTMAAMTSQTIFTLTDGSGDNDAYNNCTILIENDTSVIEKAMGTVLDYDGSTKQITLIANPAVYSMAVGDYISIYADTSLKPTVPYRTLDVSATGEAGIDWANIGSPTTVQDLSGTSIANIATILTNIAALATILSSTGTLLTASERVAIADAFMSRTLGSESYAADAVVPTLAQSLFMLLSALTQFSITTTAITTKRLDGTTAAMTYTMDSATNPTSRTRTS